MGCFAKDPLSANGFLPFISLFYLEKKKTFTAIFINRSNKLGNSECKKTRKGENISILGILLGC